MLDRILITAGLFGGTWALASVVRRWQLAIAARASGRMAARPGTPTIVYFSSPACVACRNAQKPALEQVLAEVGAHALTLISYGVEEAPEKAAEWGVRTVPTTFLLDSSGVVKQVHHGVVRADALRRELAALGASPSS